MDDFQKQLSRSWVEDENGSVDWFGGQVAFECFVDCDSVHVCIIYEPHDLVCEQISVVLRV